MFAFLDRGAEGQRADLGGGWGGMNNDAGVSCRGVAGWRDSLCSVASSRPSATRGQRTSIQKPEDASHPLLHFPCLVLLLCPAECLKRPLLPPCDSELPVKLWEASESSESLSLLSEQRERCLDLFLTSHCDDAVSPHQRPSLPRV